MIYTIMYHDYNPFFINRHKLEMKAMCLAGIIVTLICDVRIDYY